MIEPIKDELYTMLLYIQKNQNMTERSRKDIYYQHILSTINKGDDNEIEESLYQISFEFIRTRKYPRWSTK